MSREFCGEHHEPEQENILDCFCDNKFLLLLLLFILLACNHGKTNNFFFIIILAIIAFGGFDNLFGIFGNNRY